MLGRKGGLCLGEAREEARGHLQPSDTRPVVRVRRKGLPAPAWVVDSGSEFQDRQRLSLPRLESFPAFAVGAGVGRGAAAPAHSEDTLHPWAGQPSPAASAVRPAVGALRPFSRTRGRRPRGLAQEDRATSSAMSAAGPGLRQAMRACSPSGWALRVRSVASDCPSRPPG